MVHGLGALEVGDASVVIATASAHRRQAYDTNRLALERIKAEVPIWKREHYRTESPRGGKRNRSGSAGGLVVRTGGCYLGRGAAA